MKVRMLPISRLFNRYPRLVHDLLRDSDKKIQLQFRGEEEPNWTGWLSNNWPIP